MRKIFKKLKSTTINTVNGEARYQHTEVEDRLGRWNDRYTTRDGYWVIHRGKYHHVYSN